MSEKRDIKYINRDFQSFKTQLQEFTRTYFPNTYNDFSPASPGSMFIEMSSYVGDVLSFYLDNQIQETFVQYARQTNNLYELAYLLGYKPKVTTAATVNLDIYQTLPATSGNPDFNYALKVEPNAIITSTSNPNIAFLTQDIIDFSTSASLDPTEISIYELSGNTPQTYLLKKSVKAISATVNTETFTFDQPTQFTTVNLTAENIIGILDITDSDGNTWYEVDYLGQDVIYDSVRNTNTNNPSFSTNSNVPYLLQTKQVQRRFASRFLNETTLQLQFGAGTTGDTDEEITPNPNNVGLGLPFEKDKLTTAFSPTNFIFTNTYGIAPSNTTLTVRYLTGGGVQSNVDAGVLNQLSDANITFTKNNPGNTSLAQSTFDSLAVLNNTKATGGQDGDSIEELRQNSLAAFQNQLRTVTKDDYILRALSMPAVYGTVSKAYTEAQTLENLLPGETPDLLALYILSYTSAKKLTEASGDLKTNLKTYLSQYRMIGDSVKIKDAFIVNIGVDFEIVTYPNSNDNEVLLECINEITNYFNIDNWQINEPILLKDLFIALDKIEGVQTVKNITIKNLTGGEYSNYSYDVQGATVDNVVYPSIDPMIFEVKYPNTDIKGRVVSL